MCQRNSSLYISYCWIKKYLSVIFSVFYPVYVVLMHTNFIAFISVISFLYKMFTSMYLWLYAEVFKTQPLSLYGKSRWIEKYLEERISFINHCPVNWSIWAIKRRGGTRGGFVFKFWYGSIFPYFYMHWHFLVVSIGHLSHLFIL